MTPFFINSECREKIQTLRKHAENNNISGHNVIETLKGNKPPIGDDPSFVVYLPSGYRVVYSIEQQPVGTFSHLSVSNSKSSKLPSISVVETIMSEFGMGESLDDCVSFWIEENKAINVLTDF